MNNQPWIWRKSSQSATSGDCVEVARPGPVVGLRDSKNPAGGHLTVMPAAFDTLLAVAIRQFGEAAGRG
jgi:hypothetical protein